MEQANIGVQKRIQKLAEKFEATDPNGNPDHKTQIEALRIAFKLDGDLSEAVMQQQVNVNIQTWADVTRIANEGQSENQTDEEAEFTELPEDPIEDETKKE